MPRGRTSQPGAADSTKGAATEATHREAPPLPPRTKKPGQDQTSQTNEASTKGRRGQPPSPPRHRDATPEPSQASRRDPDMARAAARTAAKRAEEEKAPKGTDRPVDEAPEDRGRYRMRKQTLRERPGTPKDSREPSPSVRPEQSRHRRVGSPPVNGDPITGENHGEKGKQGGRFNKLKNFLGGGDGRGEDEESIMSDGKKDKDDPTVNHEDLKSGNKRRGVDPAAESNANHRDRRGGRDGRERERDVHGKARSDRPRADRDAAHGTTHGTDEEKGGINTDRHKSRKEREERDRRHKHQPLEPNPPHPPDEHPYSPLRYFSDQELNSNVKCKGCQQYKPQCNHCFQIMPKRQVLSRVRKREVNASDEDGDEGSDCEGCGQPIPLCRLCGLPLPKEQVLEHSKAQAKVHARV